MKTLRSRLILNTIIPLLVIIPVMGFLITYLLETQIFLGNLTNELTRQAVLVADTASAYQEIWLDPVRAQAFVTRISPRLTAKVMLLDPIGRLIVSSDPDDSFLIGQVFNVPDAKFLTAQELEAEITMAERNIRYYRTGLFQSEYQPDWLCAPGQSSLRYLQAFADLTPGDDFCSGWRTASWLITQLAVGPRPGKAYSSNHRCSQSSG